MDEYVAKEIHPLQTLKMKHENFGKGCPLFFKGIPVGDRAVSLHTLLTE